MYKLIKQTYITLFSLAESNSLLKTKYSFGFLTMDGSIFINGTSHSHIGPHWSSHLMSGGFLLFRSFESDQ